MVKASLKKSERLKQRKQIDQLFTQGKSIRKYPLKLLYATPGDVDQKQKLLFSVSVPKRRFRKAVDRNVIKRQIREAYRLEKQANSDKIKAMKKQHALMFIYIGKEKEDYQLIKRAMKNLLAVLLSYS